MPGAKYAPDDGQPATHFTFADLALADDDDVADLQARIQELALRQELTVFPQWLETAEFVLADRRQVQSRDWCTLQDPAVVVSCVGRDTQEFSYGFEPNPRVVVLSVPVCHKESRDACLNKCLWPIVGASSQGRRVVLHCNESFHRGPCGLMAILKTLLDISVEKTKEMILKRRIIWEGYTGQMRKNGEHLVRAYFWAEQLKYWNPPITRLRAKPKAKSAWEQVEDRLRAEKGKYFYRAMTQGLAEFDVQPASSQAVEGLPLAYLVLDAVATGSTRVSEFVHFSRDFMEARKWHAKGQANRHETDTLMCRVSIEALSQVHDFRRGLRNLEYLDLSSEQSWRPLFSEWAGDIMLQPLLQHLGHAEKVKEVLVAWRGSMPKALFEVVDSTTAEYIGMLDSTVPLLASSHWRQTSVEAINPAFFTQQFPLLCNLSIHSTVGFLFVTS